MMKVCKLCGGAKPADAFYANHKTRDGKDPRCRQCHNLASVVNRERRRIAARFVNRKILARTPEEYIETRSVPEPNSGCWLWIGSYNEAGYGVAYFNYTNSLAHRLSWELERGLISGGLFVCHKCDTPACVNPAHLFLGTSLDNARDMLSKGRVGRLIKDGTPAELAEKVAADPRRRDKVAAEYGLDYLTIRRIKARAQRAASRAVGEIAEPR